MQKYLIVIEKAEDNYSVFSPDIQGCITVGDTIEEAISNMKEAIELYLEANAEHGDSMPQPKGLRYHIDAGVFNDHEISEEYYISQVEVNLPKLAA
jgi:predicted RNase H-like HicB family nuclease